METRGRTQDGNGVKSGEGNERSNGVEHEDEDEKGNGNGYMIGVGGTVAKKPTKAHKSCRRHVESGGDLGRKRGKSRKEKVS